MLQKLCITLNTLQVTTHYFFAHLCKPYTLVFLIILFTVIDSYKVPTQQHDLNIFCHAISAIFTATCTQCFIGQYFCIATCTQCFIGQYSCTATCAQRFIGQYSCTATCTKCFNGQYLCTSTYAQRFIEQYS